MNEERNIDIEDGAKKEAPEPVKLTPEQTKILEDHYFKKMNQKEKAKFTAKKDAQADAEKIKEELVIAAKLKKSEKAKANRVAKDDKLTAAAMAATRRRLGLA